MHTWAKRVTALAFIGLIALGNIWLINLLTGSVAQPWTANGFFACIVIAAIGGIAMLIARFTGNTDSSS